MSTSTLARVQTRFPSAVAVAVGLAVGSGAAATCGRRIQSSAPNARITIRARPTPRAAPRVSRMAADDSG